MNDDVPMDVNYAKFEGPEARFCPAGVYEYVFVYSVEINLGSQLRYSNLLFALDMYQEKMESMVIDW